MKFLLLGFPFATSSYFISFCLTLGLISTTYSSFLAIRQVDLKKIIAYSSIAHMSLTLLGIFSLSTAGLAGALVLMIAHGFVSAALFFLVGMLYQRTGTRLLKYYGGLASICPLFTFFFFLFSCANLGFPGTLNFLGEFLIFVGLTASPALYIVFLSSLPFVLTLLYTV